MRGRGLRERSRPPLPNWCARPRKPRPPPRGCCCARPHVGRPASLHHPFPRGGRKGVAGPRLARPTFSSSSSHQSERRCHPAPPDRERGGAFSPPSGASSLVATRPMTSAGAEEKKDDVSPRSSLTSGEAGPARGLKPLAETPEGPAPVGWAGCPSAQGSSQSAAGGGGCSAVGGGGEVNGCFLRRPSPPPVRSPQRPLGEATTRREPLPTGEASVVLVQGWAVFLRGGGGKASGPSAAASRPGPRLLRVAEALPSSRGGRGGRLKNRIGSHAAARFAALELPTEEWKAARSRAPGLRGGGGGPACRLGPPLKRRPLVPLRFLSWSWEDPGIPERFFKVI